MADVGQLQSGLFDGLFHSRSCSEPFGVRCGDMVRVGGESAAQNLSIDLGSACHGVFVFFENECSRSFAHHKAVAVLVERT